MLKPFLSVISAGSATRTESPYVKKETPKFDYETSVQFPFGKQVSLQFKTLFCWAVGILADQLSKLPFTQSANFCYAVWQMEDFITCVHITKGKMNPI